MSSQGQWTGPRKDLERRGGRLFRAGLVGFALRGPRRECVREKNMIYLGVICFMLILLSVILLSVILFYFILFH